MLITYRKALEAQTKNHDTIQSSPMHPTSPQGPSRLQGGPQAWVGGNLRSLEGPGSAVLIDPLDAGCQFLSTHLAGYAKTEINVISLEVGITAEFSRTKGVQSQEELKVRHIAVSTKAWENADLMRIGGCFADRIG